jgi:hypothetical protein
LLLLLADIDGCGAAEPELVTAYHSPPETLRPLPVTWPAEVSPLYV